MPHLPRRALLAGLAAPALARAQAGRPITVVVPNPPGGGTDFAARLYQDALTRILGITVVIENRPGANGNIAIQSVARAAPDGHTLLLQYSGYHAGNPAMMPSLPWDPIRDLTPVGMATVAPHGIFAAPSLPVNSLAEFVAYTRARPGRVNYASSGNGSIQHIAGVLFARAMGVPMVHVPYRGAAPALQDVAGDRVELFITTPSSAIGLVQGGRVKALAIASAARSTALPEVPTTAEAGFPELLAENWLGLSGPRGLPAPIVQRLHAETAAGLEVPMVRHRLDEHGIASRPMTSAEFQGFVAEEVRRIGGAIRAMGITAQ
ncbi:MAG TPA: tripartite tricarboxylate transporter substrate binding protein [Acetobacteraceae bacterium]|nr:tripartite tricarboxylate transporter substrate binding protein [Acetobacteraceae bacterium]